MNDTQKAKLLELGYLEKDIPQIEETVRVTEYTLCISDADEEMTISAKMAESLLGEDEFLSGIGRSTFHWSAVKEVRDKLYVYFDSSARFKREAA